MCLAEAGELECVWLLAKFAATLIQKQQRAAGAYHNQVLSPVVVDVGKKRARGILKHAYSGCFRDVLKGAVAAVSIKPIGKTGRLANVKVVESVIVDIAD